MSKILLVEQSTPASPASGEHLFYFKTDGDMYTLDSLGVEREVVHGQGEPDGALMQYLYIQYGGL
jgi:hypothetical protein